MTDLKCSAVSFVLLKKTKKQRQNQNTNFFFGLVRKYFYFFYISREIQDCLSRSINDKTDFFPARQLTWCLICCLPHFPTDTIVLQDLSRNAATFFRFMVFRFYPVSRRNMHDKIIKKIGASWLYSRSIVAVLGSIHDDRIFNIASMLLANFGRITYSAFILHCAAFCILSLRKCAC